MANSIKKVVGLLLPPVKALTELAAPLHACQPNWPSDLASKELVVDEAFIGKLGAEYKKHENVIQNSITKWLQDSRKAFDVVLASIEEDERPSTLFVITTPEFCFNGYNQAGIRYNAANPQPAGLETWIEEEVKSRFAGLNKVHVLFCFSFTGYNNRLLSQPTGKVIEGYSRINVIPLSDANLLQQIPKLKSSSMDGWPKDIFAQVVPATNPHDRLQQVQVPLEKFWPGIHCNDGNPLVLAFATCADAETQENGMVNFVILIGSDSPLESVGDTTHEFLLNDCVSWQPIVSYERIVDGKLQNVLGPASALLKASGWYVFVSPEMQKDHIPGVNEVHGSVGQRIRASKSKTGESASQVNENMENCFYLDGYTIDPTHGKPADGEFWFKYTAAVELPKLVAQEEPKGVKAVSSGEGVAGPSGVSSKGKSASKPAPSGSKCDIL